jgi:TPR repeat protein
MRTLGARKLVAVMFLGAALSALAAITTASAGPLEDGIEALNRGDYATALRLYRPLAIQGNGFAQFNLGLMHLTGTACRRTTPRP